MDFMLRGWQAKDAESLAKYANNPKVALFLREGFAQPYRLKDAEQFIENCLKSDPAEKIFYAIDEGGEAIGSIGVFKRDNIYRKSAELAYWLGEPFWGQGIMTDAVSRICCLAFEQLDIVRLSAEPFAHNAGSRRVLEGAGFELEGVHKKSIFKNGQLYDSCTYALLRDNPRINN